MAHYRPSTPQLPRKTALRTNLDDEPDDTSDPPDDTIDLDLRDISNRHRVDKAKDDVHAQPDRPVQRKYFF